MLFSDWNRSGAQSLRVSSDCQYYKGGQEQLWKIDGATIPKLHSKAEGWKDLHIWGMGIASRDVTGNGHPDYYLTSMGDNKLRVQSGDPSRPAYKDMARKLGITAHSPFVVDSTLPSTGWHAQFDDVNNDGFTEAADVAVLASPKHARGTMVADFNLDGLLDVAVVNREENIQIWRNVGIGIQEKPVPMGNWVALSIRQTEINKQAVGAWVEVRSGDHVQRKEITIGGGHALWHHFGVGVAERATVRIQ